MNKDVHSAERPGPRVLKVGLSTSSLRLIILKYREHG